MEKWAPKERKREKKKSQKMENNLTMYDIMCCNIELINPKASVKIISVYLR